MQRKSRSVVDTGILISAFAFGGIPQKALLKAHSETQIYVSPEILNEYREVPNRLLVTGKIDTKQHQFLISGIASFVVDAKIVTPIENLYVCRDPKDNMLLECCKKAHADYLITGDRDLLDISSLQFSVKIFTPCQFLNEKFYFYSPARVIYAINRPGLVAESF